MVKIQTVMQQCDAFIKAVLPKDAGCTQKQEMIKAFYAGQLACLRTMVDGVSYQPEEQGVIILEALLQECYEFFGVKKS
jgi:hypothetical protein